MPKNENRELQEAVGLVRDIEATLAIKHPNSMDERFTSALLHKAEAELPRLETSMVRRCYTAACGVEFASDDVLAFRLSCQKRQASAHGFTRTVPPSPRAKAAAPT
jgi:hypothetical protein